MLLLLLRHGFPAASPDFGEIRDDLAREYRLLTLDFPGPGLSEKPYPHDDSILEQASPVKALLEQAGVEQCHVLAHDHGDTVLQEPLGDGHFLRSLPSIGHYARV